MEDRKNERRTSTMTDRTKSGRPIPGGMEQCHVCGEYRGWAKAKELDWEDFDIDGNIVEGICPDPEEILTASCLCSGILCRRCQKNKIHRPTSNSYDPNSNSIGHWPYFSGMAPCKECAEREEEMKRRRSMH